MAIMMIITLTPMPLETTKGMEIIKITIKMGEYYIKVTVTKRKKTTVIFVVCVWILKKIWQ
jgi:hypothetical protein